MFSAPGRVTVTPASILSTSTTKSVGPILLGSAVRGVNVSPTRRKGKSVDQAGFVEKVHSAYCINAPVVAPLLGNPHLDENGHTPFSKPHPAISTDPDLIVFFTFPTSKGVPVVLGLEVPTMTLSGFPSATDWKFAPVVPVTSKRRFLIMTYAAGFVVPRLMLISILVTYPLAERG